MFAVVDAEITYLFYCYHRSFDMLVLSSTIWIETDCWEFCCSLVRILRFFQRMHIFILNMDPMTIHSAYVLAGHRVYY